MPKTLATVTITRSQFARLTIAEKQLEIVDRLLTEAGVPEWVDDGTSFSNSVASRAKYFIYRRKSLSVTEQKSISKVCKDLNEDFRRIMKGLPTSFESALND